MPSCGSQEPAESSNASELTQRSPGGTLKRVSVAGTAAAAWSVRAVAAASGAAHCPTDHLVTSSWEADFNRVGNTFLRQAGPGPAAVGGARSSVPYKLCGLR